MPRLLSLSLFLSLVLLTVACAAIADPPSPTAAPPPTATPTPSAASPVITPEPQGLTMWLPAWMMLEQAGAAERLQATLDEFAASRGLFIDVVIKPPRGEGGLLDFLSTAYPVAPGVLPDLIALPFDDAETAAATGLLQPLDALIPEPLRADLFPFAHTIARSDGAWLALPFVADFEHLAFQPTDLADLPLSWVVVLESRAPYAFPAAGPEAVLTDALIIHYLSAVRPGEQAERNERALREMLSFYETARIRALIDASTLEASHPEDTWPRALHADVALAHTTASLWLTDRQQVTRLRFGPVPTADSTPRYLARGWAYAIVTAEPQRQALAGALIANLMQAEVLGSWSQAANRLPARRAALAAWPANDFRFFSTEALENATRPSALFFDQDFTRSVHRAVIEVLSGAATAELATGAAVQNW